MNGLSTMNRSKGEETARTTLLIVLGSETFFFGTLISAYLFLRAEQINWPYTHAPLTMYIVPAFNTVLLLVSALTVFFGRRSILQEKEKTSRGWYLLSLVLGLVFLAGQVFEFLRAGMSPSDQAFGGVFFTLMGFHGLHLLAGIIVLLLLAVRLSWGDFNAHRHVAIDIGTWFWYYVVGVWVVLFSVLYLI